MQFYNCLIIDPDSKSRMLLKQAMSVVVQFNESFSVKNERIALDLLKRDKKSDLIFISDKIDKSRIIKFIKEAKETNMGFLAGYILLCSKKNDAKSFANSLLDGIDGILIEPYSIDSLQELSLLAAEVKSKREDEKRRMVFRFLVESRAISPAPLARAGHDGRAHHGRGAPHGRPAPAAAARPDAGRCGARGAGAARRGHRRTPLRSRRPARLGPGADERPRGPAGGPPPLAVER